MVLNPLHLFVSNVIFTSFIDREVKYAMKIFKKNLIRSLTYVRYGILNPKNPKS